MKEESFLVCLSILLCGGIILHGVLRGLYLAINMVIGRVHVLERIFGVSVGAIAGVITGGIITSEIVVRSDDGTGYWIAGWILGLLAGLIVGVSTGVSAGVSAGEIVGLLAGLSAGRIAGEIVGRIAELLTPIFILLIYRRIICEHCLRYTEPLRSTYNNGTRHCEHCKESVARTKECGRVVFTFGNYQPKQGNRMFILSEPPCEEFYNQSKLIDLSKVYIDTKTADKFHIEQFITYILNYPPPKYGLKSVGIFYKGNLDDLAHLKNSILNNFKRVTKLKNG